MRASLPSRRQASTVWLDRRNRHTPLSTLVFIILNSTLTSMKKSITQEFDYGCGVACFAFACDISYQQAVTKLGREQSVAHGWRPSDLVKALNDYGHMYKNHYVRKKEFYPQHYPEGTIVLIERSETYPVGHYLIKHHDQWMDPWITMPTDSKLSNARSGFRKKLPGKVMYALIPRHF